MSNSMNKYTFLIFLTLIFSNSCVKEKVNEDSAFIIPYLINDTISNTCNLIQANSLDDSWPQFLRKDRIIDTLDLTSELDSNFVKDFLYENYYDALDSL